MIPGWFFIGLTLLTYGITILVGELRNYPIRRLPCWLSFTRRSGGGGHGGSSAGTHL